MLTLLRKLFNRPQRHYVVDQPPHTHAMCKCGHQSVWDWDLRKHFEETGRIGK